MSAGEGAVVVKRGRRELIARLAPLWMALHEHHTAVAPQVGRVCAYRTAEESRSVRRSQYERWLAGEDGYALLAEQNAVGIGYAVAGLVPAGPTLQTGERLGELASLSVLPGKRGLGVGSVLMAEVHRWLAERGATVMRTSVMAHNVDAERFYRRFGMVGLNVDLIGRVPPTAECAEGEVHDVGRSQHS